MEQPAEEPASSTTANHRVEISLSLVLPDEAKPTLSAYRSSRSDLDSSTLAVVDELLENGRAQLSPGWASGAGAGVGEPDRGDSYIS